jgi:hypothetical protein
LLADIDIVTARDIPESERTDVQKGLAKREIYFADDEGNLDEEKYYEIDDGRDNFIDGVNGPELRLLEELRTTPVPDVELIMPSIDGFIFSVRLLEIGCTRTSRKSTPRNNKNVSILLSMLACLKHLTRSAGLYNYLE